MDQPLAVVFTAFADVWPRATERHIKRQDAEKAKFGYAALTLHIVFNETTL